MFVKLLLCPGTFRAVIDPREACAVTAANQQFTAHRHLHRDSRCDINYLPRPCPWLTNPSAD